MKRTHIIGTGHYLPEMIVTNDYFHRNQFYNEGFEPIDQKPEEITKKFTAITGIEERRYIDEDQDSSGIGLIAAQRAIEDAGIDPETIDQIIFAHNFGDVQKHTVQTDVLPALASRVKHALGIKNPFCVAYDLLFGCPGWIQGIIQSNSFLKAGDAVTTLVIGSETLSRVIDKFDRDSMIFADGAGACVLRFEDSDRNSGILSTAAMTHTVDEAYYLYFGKSNLPESDPHIRYIKMKGRKVFEYALTHVPAAMKKCLDDAGVDIKQVKKVFIHQANQKLDEGVIKRLYKLYDIDAVPEGIMPMSVHEFGNSSVATVPTLFDRVKKGMMPAHNINEGDVVLFASVGSGMNINAVCYRM
ncbi:MAG: ketoacyl-ACP synthase III [Salibacteraceae bacterium]